MICSNCGQQNNEDAKFCAKCGTPLTSSVNNTAANLQNSKDKKKKKKVRKKGKRSKVKLILIPILIIAILAAAAFFILKLGPAPQNTVTEFMTDAGNVKNEDDLKNLFDKYTVNGLDDESLEEFSEKIDSLGIKKPQNLYELLFYFQDLKITSSHKDSEHADVECSVVTRDFDKIYSSLTSSTESSTKEDADKIIEKMLQNNSTNTITLSFSLEKVDGKWKIEDSESALSSLVSNPMTMIEGLL